MADELNTSTAPESESTPVSGEPVEVTPEVPSERSDAWDFSDVKDDEVKKDEPEPAKAEEPVKEEAKKDTQDEKPLEDQVLEELFDPEKAKSEKDASKDEEIDKADPTAMIKAQENASGRAWAERAEKVYTPFKDFKYGTKTAAELRESLTGFLGEEKAKEYSQFEAHQMVDTNPEAAFQRAYVVAKLKQDPTFDYRNAELPSLDDLVNGKLAPSTVSTETVDAAIPTEITDVTKELDSVLDWDWRNPELDANFVDERELAMAKTVRALEAKALSESKAKSELSEKVVKLEKLEQTVQSMEKASETEAQKAFNKDLETSVNDFRNSIETKILPFIAKSTGLEVSKDDTPEVVAFKQRKMELYTGDAYEKSKGFASRFETFAYNESKVQQDLNTLAANVVNTRAEILKAAKAGDTKEASRLESELESFRIPTIQLLAAANEEFKAKFIDPDIQLMGLKAAKIAAPILEAEQRIETVANGGGTPSAKKPVKDYRNADDVWGSMAEESAQEERLQSAA